VDFELIRGTGHVTKVISSLIIDARGPLLPASGAVVARERSIASAMPGAPRETPSGSTVYPYFLKEARRSRTAARAFCRASRASAFAAWIAARADWSERCSSFLAPFVPFNAARSDFSCA
jgi:hypothetical protein